MAPRLSDAPVDVRLIATILRPEEKLIVEALNAAGLEVTVSLDTGVDTWVNDGNGRQGMVVMRSLSHHRALSLAQMLEATGVVTVNTAAAVRICANKALQALEFRRCGVPHPEFRISATVDEVRRHGEELGSDYVIKPLDASWGRGIARIRHLEALESWAAARESVDAKGNGFPVLTQRYVNKGDSDLRVVVVGDQPIAAIRRVADGWLTNTHRGARIETTAITAEVRQLVAKTVATVGEGIYGIDLLEDLDSGRLLVCEINQNPEFNRSMPVHGVDIPRHIAEFVSRRLETTAAVSVRR